MPNRWRSEPKVTYKMERTRSRSRSGSGSSGESGSTPSSAGRGAGAGGSNKNKSKRSVGSTNGSAQKRKESFDNGHTSNSGVEATEQGRNSTSSSASKMDGVASAGRGKARASSIGSSSSEDFASPSPARSDKKVAANSASSSMKMPGTSTSGKKRSASPGRSTSPRKQIVARKSIGVGVPVQSNTNDGPMDQQKSTCKPGGKSLGSAFDAASASVSTLEAKSAAGPANDGVGNSSSVTSSGGSASTKRKRGGTPSSAAVVASSAATKKNSDSTPVADNDVNVDNGQTNVQTTNAKKAKKSRKSLSCEDDPLSSSSDEAESGDKSSGIDRDASSNQKKGDIPTSGKPGNAGDDGADDDVIEIIDDDSSASGGDAEEEKRESQSSSQSVTGYDIEKDQPATSNSQAPVSNFDGMELDKEEEEEKKEDVIGAETSPTTPKRKTSAVHGPSLFSSNQSMDGSPMNIGCDEEINDDADEKDRPIDPEAVICWACSIPLQRKGAADKTPIDVVDDTDENGWGEKAKTLGLYSIHAHPLLQISVCSACADKAYDVEDEALQCEAARAHGGDSGAEDDDGADPTEMEACSLCAVEATQDDDCPLFLCCDACPRIFCARCVAILNGGRKYVDDEEAEWSCPACDPPDFLDRMQVAFVGWSDEGATVETDRQLIGGDKEGNGIIELLTTAALIEELNYAEDGLFEAEKRLENDGIAKEREVVLAEVRKDRSDLSATEKLKEVDAEMEGWIQQWQDHHSRLSEAVTTLQDALELRGIDLAAFYKDREANVLAGGEQGSSADDVPGYVRDAEAALDKRDEEEGFGKGEFRGSSGYKMDKNVANLDVEDLSQPDINEIEDINTLEGTLAQLEHISRRNDSNKDRPCRWSKTDLTEGDIDNMRKRALRRDDEDLARLNIDVEKLERTGIKEDADAAKEKDVLRKDTTRKTAGGVRINLLALSTVKKKKKAERQSAKKAKKRERESANGPRYGVAFSGVQRNASAEGGIVQPVRERLASEVSRREAKWAAAAAAQGGKATKRRIAPMTIATGPGISRNLFSSSSVFASLMTTLVTSDRYGDAPTKGSQTATMPFEESNLSLPSGKKDDGGTISVTVVKPLAAILKTHQVDGVKFMWENTCSDLLSAADAKVDGSESPDQIKGAILAHNMGLGKSVQLCTYLHTFLAHPSIVNSSVKKRLPQSSTPSGATSWHGTSTDPSSPTTILRSLQNNSKRRALLCVPVNTIANWENEWTKWILAKEKGKQVPQVSMYNLNSHHSNDRLAVLVEWMKEGGVLLTSDRILSGLCKHLVQPSKKKSSKSSKNKKAKPAVESGTDNDTDTGATTEASSRSTSQMTEMDKELIKAALLEPGPDVVCLDEGHQMLKNSSTNISRALHLMKGCPRRIVLTGTPIQNNLKEAYRMAKWTNPSCRLGTEADFTRNFSDPIMDGMKKDATAQELFAHDNALKQLHEILDSFVQRRGADVLANDLPPMQQCVINIRQSKLQQKLYRQFGRYKKQPGVRNNFFDQYQKLRPVNNHPATLLIPGRDDKRNNQSSSPVPESLPSSRLPSPKPQTLEDGVESNTNNDLTPTKSNSNSTKPKAVEEQTSAPKQANEGADDEIVELDDFSDEDAPPNASASVTAGAPLGRKSSDEEEEEKWWKPVHDKTGDDDFMDIREGGKIVLLLEILTYADILGDKVVCFTQCLKTIDYIERVLNSPDWGKTIPTIAALEAAEGRTWGQWRRNREYLRIDGATSASDRGDLVSSFNQSHDSSSSKALENQAKLFLISKEAGGIGINLHAANRVILFDSHWNPSVDLQAIYRCYRYGQTKSVFAYRFLTEGTMEDKIYSRSVNKSGLAARVIDQKHPERAFLQSELEDILTTNTMVCCDLCDRWRVIPPWAETGPDEFEGFWCCEMNKYDKPRAKCEAKERDQAWYHSYFQKELVRRQKKDQAKLERQKQREKLALSQQSQDILGSQSQELTLYESEMRESVDDRPRVDPNKGRNTDRDLVLRRLLKTVGGSNSSHQNSSKKGQKKHVTSWISKYHFHESLLKDDENAAQNSKDAAAAVAADAAAKATADAVAVDDSPMGGTTSSAAAANSSAKPPSSKKKGKSQSSNSSDGSGEGAQTAITNSPPPSPDTAASSKKKRDDRSSVPIKSETDTATTKKRAKNDPSDESNDGGANGSSAKKPRLSTSANEKSGGEVHVITHHENGHDVLEILDSDDDEEEGTEKVAEEKSIGNANRAVNDYGDNDEDEDYDDEGVDGVLV